MTDDPDNPARRLQEPEGEDSRAAGQLLDQHRDRLRKMVRLRLDRRLHGRIDPSDVVQEALLEASSRLQSRVDNPSMPLFLWLRFITAQKLLELHRRHLGAKKRDARREISIDRVALPEASSVVLAAQLVGRQSTPSNAAQRAERRIQLQEAIDRMDAIDREVLALRHFEELSNKETARELDISPTAANNRYMRALKRLRAVLEKSPAGAEDWIG